MKAAVFSLLLHFSLQKEHQTAASKPAAALCHGRRTAVLCHAAKMTLFGYVSTVDMSPVSVVIKLLGIATCSYSILKSYHLVCLSFEHHLSNAQPGTLLFHMQITIASSWQACCGCVTK